MPAAERWLSRLAGRHKGLSLRVGGSFRTTNMQGHLQSRRLDSASPYWAQHNHFPQEPLSCSPEIGSCPTHNRRELQQHNGLRWRRKQTGGVYVGAWQSWRAEAVLRCGFFFHGGEFHGMSECLFSPIGGGGRGECSRLDPKPKTALSFVCFRVTSTGVQHNKQGITTVTYTPLVFD